VLQIECIREEHTEFRIVAETILGEPELQALAGQILFVDDGDAGHCAFSFASR
jgi:hypothetical protein